MLYLKNRGFMHAHSAEITPRAMVEGRRNLLRQVAAGSAVISSGPKI